MFFKLCITVFTLCALAGTTFSATIRKSVVEPTVQDPVLGKALLDTIEILKQRPEVAECSKRIEIVDLLHSPVEVQPEEYPFVKTLFTSVAKVFENKPVPLAALRYYSKVTAVSTPLTVEYYGKGGFISKVESSEFTPGTPTYLDAAIKMSSQLLMKGDQPNKIILAHADGEATFEEQQKALTAARTFTATRTNKICVIATKPTPDTVIPEATKKFLQDIAQPENLRVVDQYPSLPDALKFALACACDERALLNVRKAVQ